MKVLTGTRVHEGGAVVPAHYQASVFPAFVWFAGSLGLDMLKRRDRRTWVPRAALLASTGLLATARLGGALPLSGHAVFLAAVIGYALAPPRALKWPAASEAPAAWLAAPGLAITAWYKLALWNDPGWLTASIVTGGAIGFSCARWARAGAPAAAATNTQN
jgi:hypothetical protein